MGRHETTPRSALMLDLYELTMAQSYFALGMRAPATFSLFIRRLPANWGYFIAAGLPAVLDYLESLSFSDDDADYLRSTGLFGAEFLQFLRGMRFTGTVRALPEGTVFYPEEPILEVTGPVIEAQLVETVVIKAIMYPTLVASKASRAVNVAGGRRLVDFGLRRAHLGDAGMALARSSYLAGFDSTSNVLAGREYGIPIAGTMAHSYIEAFSEEIAAFRAYAAQYPDSTTLLIDTYDTIEGARRAAVVGQELRASGHRLRAVRIDSGDVIALSRPVRDILDEAGLKDTTIFVSGNLDERSVADAVAAGAPIDGFGIGTKLAVGADSPSLDIAYKLVEYLDRPVMKRSPGKVSWPGAKQIWRDVTGDSIALASEVGSAGAEPLLVTALSNGRRLVEETLDTVRARVKVQLAALPPEAITLMATAAQPVRYSDRLVQLRSELLAEME